MVDVLNSSLGSRDNSGAGGALPDFPEENPSNERLDPFLDKWDKYVAKQGYAPFLRGQEPAIPSCNSRSGI